MKEILNNILYIAKRFKLASTFNMVGLIVAFASFYLLMTQVIYQFTYNHSLEDYQRLYRMESDYVYDEWDYSDNICSAFAATLSDMPAVQSFSLATNIENQSVNYWLPFQKGDKIKNYLYTSGNNTAVSTLTSRKLCGSIEWTDDDQEGIIIPASIALDYFGTTQAAGDSLMYYYAPEQSAYPLVVRGVFEDFDDNNEAWNCIYGNMHKIEPTDFNFLSKCIIKFKTVPDDLAAWTDSLKQSIINNALHAVGYTSLEQATGDEIFEDLTRTNFKLTPLKSSYFEHSSFTSGASGYKAQFYILVLSCLILIIIATINFLNFTLVESPMRIRSINARLILGAERKSLRRQLVAECVIIAAAACIIALVICSLLARWPEISLPLEGSILPTQHAGLTLFTLLIALIAGTVAGIYPALFATSFPAVVALKGAFGLSPQGHRLRMVLVGLQLFLSSLLASYFGILFLQSDYIFNSAYGFKTDNYICATFPEYSTDAATRDQLKKEVMSLSEVTNVTFSDDRLGSSDGFNVLKSRSQGNIIGFRYIHIDHNYMKAMGIKVIQGRDFNETDTSAVIITRAASRKWPWMHLGSKLSTSLSSDSSVVVGICENIRFGTTRIKNDSPFTFVLNSDNRGNVMNVLLTPGADIELLKQEISTIAGKYFKTGDTKVSHFSDLLAKTYKSEFRFFNQTFIITIICLIITLIGIFCITIFETEYRRKEIGIRKVLGATTGQIVWMLCRRYGWMLLICFAIAAPLATYLGKITLEYFAQHAVINWWIIPLSLLIVGAIMIGTVALQSRRTARENPVNSIKTE